MQIEDFLSHSVERTKLNRVRREVKTEAFTAAAAGVDKVTLSKAAKEMRQNTPDLQKAARFAQKNENGASAPGAPAEPENPARLQFKTYMDKALNRGVASGPKTPEERIEEETEKIKKLKTRLAELMTDNKIPENVKSGRMEAIESQIKAAQEVIDRIGVEIAEQAAR